MVEDSADWYLDICIAIAIAAFSTIALHSIVC